MVGTLIWRVKTSAGRVIGEYDSSAGAHAAGLWRIRDKRGKVRGEYTDLSAARRAVLALSPRLAPKIYRVKTTVYKVTRKQKKPKVQVAVPSRKALETWAAVERYFATVPSIDWARQARKARETEGAIEAHFAERYKAVPVPVPEPELETGQAYEPELAADKAQLSAMDRGIAFLRDLLGPGAVIESEAHLDGTVDIEVRIGGGLDFLDEDRYQPSLERGATLPGFWVQFGSKYMFGKGDAEQGKYRSQGLYPPRFAHPQRIAQWAHNLQWQLNMNESMQERSYAPHSSVIRLFWNPWDKMPDRRGSSFDDKDWT